MKTYGNIGIDIERLRYRKANLRALSSWRSGSLSLELSNEKTSDPPDSQACGKYGNIKQETRIRLTRPTPTPISKRSDHSRHKSTADEVPFQSSTRLRRLSKHMKKVGQAAAMTNTIFGNASRYESKESLESSAIKTKSRWIWGEREKVSALRETNWRNFPAPTPQRARNRPFTWRIPNWRAGKAETKTEKEVYIQQRTTTLSNRDASPFKEPHPSDRRRPDSHQIIPRTSLSPTFTEILCSDQSRVDSLSYSPPRSQRSGIFVGLEEVVPQPVTPEGLKHKQQHTENAVHMVVDEQDGGVALSPLTSNVTIERGKGRLRSGGRFLPALGGGVEITPYYPMGEAKAERARGSLDGGEG